MSRFRITSDEMPGLAKLAEECSEIAKDACKIMGGADSLEMIEHLMDEMGDVYAALRFFIDHNEGLDLNRIYERANEKEIRWSGKRVRRLHECRSS